VCNWKLAPCARDCGVYLQDYMLMNPEVREIDGRGLLITAKRKIEALMKRKKETVEVYLVTL